MSAAPQPIVALGDTLTLALLLLAARHLLLWRWGFTPRVWRAALWIRRIAAVVVILPALRLFALAGYRPEAAGQLWGIGLAILGAGALALLVDLWIVRRLRARRQP